MASPSKPKIETTESAEIVEERPYEGNLLHNEVLNFMRSYREKNSGFTFWLRERNTNNRLNEGFWFQGSERYAFVGLYKAPGNNRTRSVGLVFWPSGKGKTGVSFEVTFSSEVKGNLLEFYREIEGIMKLDYIKTFEVRGDNKFRVTLAYEQPYRTAEKFLNKYKRIFDRLIKKLSLDHILISEKEFADKLSRIEALRMQIEAEGLQKNEEIIEDKEELIEEEELEKELRVLSALTSSISFRDRRGIEPVIGAKELAGELANLIRELKPEKGMMMGLFGQWGRGKTFLFEQVWEDLEQDKTFVRVDFHAWKYQSTSAFWGYLYESFAEEYYGKDPIKRFWKIMRLNYERLNKYSFWFFIIGGLIAVGKFSIDQFQGKSGGMTDFLIWLLPFTALLPSFVTHMRKYTSRAKVMMKKYSTRLSYKQLLGVQAEIQRELATLLKVWTRKEDKRFILFVDDIDRCGEERIMEMVDALRVMLEDEEISKRVVVFAAIDERILRRAIRLKYEKLLSGEKENDTYEKKIGELTAEYLDKLFITSIKLNTLTQEERKAIFRAIIPLRDVSEILAEKEPIDVSKKETPVAESAEQGLTASVPGEEQGSDEEQAAGFEEDAEGTTYETKIDENGVAHVIKHEYEVFDWEANLLESGILSLIRSTPRQIRIFYFRYLLARSFMQRLKNNSSWGNEEDIRLLIDLIVVLTNADLVKVTVKEVLTDDEAEGLEEQEYDDYDPEYIKIMTLERFQSQNDKMRNDLANVLEMVVAY